MIRIAHIAPSARSRISAAWRLRQAQENLGLDAFALVHMGTQGSHVRLIRQPESFASLRSRFTAKLDSLPLRLCLDRKRNLPWNVGWTGYHISNCINKIAPDIVNLHWVAAGCVNLRTLHRIACPLVWTFHDVWPLTGGCHCNLGCQKWNNECLDCPQLGSTFGGIQLAHKFWNLKKNAYASISRLAVITPSRWLGNIARQSPLLDKRRIVVIPNCLDLNLFRPQSKEDAQRALGLPINKRIILFAAAGGIELNYKGFDLLLETLSRLKESIARDIHLLILGSYDKGTFQIPFPATFLGHLSNEEALAQAYNAADVFVSPSRQDNFPSTFLEAAACGLPSVGFDVGGIPEIALHKESGYIAPQFDTSALAYGIQWVLESEVRHAFLSRQARAHAEKTFAPAIVAQQYLDLYNDILC